MAFRFRAFLSSVTVAAFLAASVVPGFANPTGGAVAAGSATISTTPHAVIVHQTSNRAIINWQSFSIGSGEVTRFKQPSSSSAVLNRVTSSDPSQIYGLMKSNGTVYLINPNGIVIGPNGQIKTGGFVASTLDVNDAVFMAGGPLSLFGTSPAGIVNLGLIHAASGDVALLASQVQNAGTIAAPNGTVALGSGSQILYAPGGGDDTILIQAPSLTPPNGAAIDNEGVIAAAAAQLKAAGGNPYALAVNNGGVISATTVHNDGGRVIIDGGNGTTVDSGTIHADATGSGNGGYVSVSGGNTTFTGAITARGGPNGGDGGNAEVSGQSVNFLGSVDMTAAKGKMGTVLIDPVNEVIDSAVAANIDNALEGAGIVEQGSSSITLAAPISATGSGMFALDSPTIILDAGITYTGGTVQFQNSFGTSGSSVTSTSSAPISAQNINIGGSFVYTGGPLASAVFNGALSGIVNVNTPSGGTSLTATNASNAITQLNFQGANAYSGAINVGTSSAISVSGTASAGSFTLASSGNLTLTPGTVLTSSGGNTTLASTGGVFINGAGAGALPGPGRTLIYSTTDANGFSDGGLGYTEYSGVSYPSDPQGTGNVEYVVTATNLPFMTITANNFSRLYGGVDAFTYSLSGGSTSNLTTMPQFGIQQGSDTNVGTYTIVPFGAASSTNRINYVDGTLTIKRAPLTITAPNISGTYGAVPSDFGPYFAVQYSGLVNGDTSSVVVNVNSPGLPLLVYPNLSQSSVAGLGVGTYPIVLQDDVFAANYTIRFVPGTLNVNPATLYYTANNVTVQQGSPIPAFSVSLSGLVNGDTPGKVVCCFSFPTTATASSPAGQYAIGAFPGELLSPNYFLAPNPKTNGAGTLTLTPAPTVIITGLTPLNTNYQTPSSKINFTPQTTGVTTGTAGGPGPGDPLGLSGTAAVVYETDAINSLETTYNLSATAVDNALSGTGTITVNGETINIRAQLEQSIYNDLSTALKALNNPVVYGVTSLTDAQQALITAVENFVQSQQEATAKQGQAAFSAWLNSQPNSATTLVSAGLVVPQTFLNEASAGITLSSAQTATVDGILSYNSSGKATTVQLGTYTGPSGLDTTEYQDALNAVVQSANQPVTSTDLSSLMNATTGPNLAAYLSAMMVTGNP